MHDQSANEEYVYDGLTAPPRPEVPDDQKVNRRTAFAEFALMIAPFANQIRGLIAGRPPRPQNAEKEKYPLTDVTHELKDGGSLRNIGVRHTSEDMKIDKEFLEKAIDGAEVVLLEGGEREENFFRLLRDYAESKGKIVYDIDHHRRQLLETQYQMSLMVPAGIGAINGIDDFANHDEQADTLMTRQGSRRNFLRGAAAAAGLLHLPTYIGSGKGGTEPYPSHRVSYVIDGRTVKMVTNLKEIEREYSGKKIVSITGYTHADGIEYYNKHPELYAARKAIYDKTYEPVYGLPKKRLV